MLAVKPSARRVVRAMPAFLVAATASLFVIVIAVPAAAQPPAGPAGCVPVGTAQLPPGLPSMGGQGGLAQMPEYRGDSAPERIDLRTPATQFNRFYEFALVDAQLLARPRGEDGPWRHGPMPDCLEGTLVGISVDDDELVGIDDAGWIYTLDNVTQDPALWNWTSAWGAMLWTAPGQTLPGSIPGAAPAEVAENTWALSITSPWDNRSYTDIAGRVHPSGWAKMTMVPALTGDGSTITYADPWLPNDDSYEIGAPLGGRFQATSLSAAASTTMVMNRYGDIYTRTFDFDSSGSDTVFFRYSWFDQSDKPSATILPQETLDRGTAAIQLPAPDWTRQPKVPGEITSVISVHATGPGPEKRELRVEGSQNGETGYWHKDLHTDAWQFTATGAEPIGDPVENPAEDRSADTLADPAPWNLAADLPARDALIDGELLHDIGLPYGVIDLRWLDEVGQHATPSGYRLEVGGFDPAVSTREAIVRAPGGEEIPVLLHTADGLRMHARGAGLDDDPRQMIGAIEILPGAFTDRDDDPVLSAFITDWMQDRHIAPVTLSATARDLVVR